MAKIHNLGFPRIGKKRELKYLLEDFWNDQISQSALTEKTSALWHENLAAQANLDCVPVGDFSLYDHVLDTSFMVGNIPSRFKRNTNDSLLQYFTAARGTAQQGDCGCAHAAEMTKWFDTNYHYIVPEIDASTSFSLNAAPLLKAVKAARCQGHDVKPVILGPVTYLWLSRTVDNTEPLDYLRDLLPVYKALLDALSGLGVAWVQIDEPALTNTLPVAWQLGYQFAYEYLKREDINTLLTTYFGSLKDNFDIVAGLPVAGFHLDVTRGTDEADQLANQLRASQVLSVGVIDGRNVWKAPLDQIFQWLSPLNEKLGNRLWLAPSCSLLHVPVDVQSETRLPAVIKDKLAFATQKLDELVLLKKALTNQDASLPGNDRAVRFARQPAVSANNILLNGQDATLLTRATSFTRRYELQQAALNLPVLPTTTIGSFPQTAEIRQARLRYKRGQLPAPDYEAFIKKQIAHCIKTQEALGLDVLVHGEAERNDMVEYFGEKLTGVAVTSFGWVQSYGSRCVKPPLIHDDVKRHAPLTTSWIAHAQSLTDKPVKGMLTGPVTILNWSFVRDDLARADVAQQIGFAIREEVQELEAQGTKIIQVDEAALREGLPLRQEETETYLTWAVNAFKLCTSGVKPATQIHTHMCYSEFSDIRDAIINMDADVITIEAARSQHTILALFSGQGYPNAIGPGVYDIHSPVCPTQQALRELTEYLTDNFDISRLWINPDCGLKTRTWPQVTAALQAMVDATKHARERLSGRQKNSA